jgi:hypothetical protein
MRDAVEHLHGRKESRDGETGLVLVLDSRSAKDRFEEDTRGKPKGKLKEEETSRLNR